MHSKHKENWKKNKTKKPTTTIVTKIVLNTVEAMTTLNQYFNDLPKQKKHFIQEANYNQK